MDELSKSFEPTLVEEKWYAFWEENGYFAPDGNPDLPPYSLVMPPPNVTGTLHMGHALVNTLQDVLARWKRMSGFSVCWVPGTDHAGIATQTVVEKHLIAQTGKRRKDFSREEFLSHVWQWKEKSQNSILHQLKKLGCSCDWSRLCFTLDKPRSLAVRQVFKKMFTDGLIYRGDYLVNWDPVTQTALADDEVEYEEKSSFLWYLRYPIAEEEGFVVIATTRPETLLGDTAVAVSTEDPRYNHLIGKQLIIPFVERRVPIIADHRIDASFGSGAVKVTPAHDPNDYEMALSHSLAFVNIMTPDGKINDACAEFQGMTMEEARAAIVAKMEQMGLVEKIVPHIHRVGISYRSKAVIEPYLSKQWFVKMSAFKTKLRSLVQENQVRLIPKSWENTYFHWIDNLRDWCISRQLWWGHRIPIWYHVSDPNRVLCSAEEMPEEVAKDPTQWIQEEDVLDTWFSSALWPFSTLGWPEQTSDLARFYPNATLITGHDILFFWVARMILMGSYVLDTPPFPETFLHGLIYGKSYWKQKKDEAITYITGEERLSYDLGKPIPKDVHHKWEKMSKSKGNVIDPLEIIHSFGTDAMRMALCSSATQARQIDLDRRKFEEYKNFANKVWNGARFVFMNLQDLSADSLSQGIDTSLFTLEDRWILALLKKTIDEVNEALSQYQFDKAAFCAYDFFWKEFCAYYVEICKPYLTHKVAKPAVRENKQKILCILLSSCIRLLHPMAPFITEELFQTLKKKFSVAALPKADLCTQECLRSMQAPSCMKAPFPTSAHFPSKDLSVDSAFALLEEVLHSIRNIRAEMQLPPSTATEVYIVGDLRDPLIQTVQENTAILESLVKIQSLHFVSSPPSLSFEAQKRVRSFLLVIPLPQEMREKELHRLYKEKDRLQGQLLSLSAKLEQEDFLAKAPKEVLTKLQTQKKGVERQLQEIEAKLPT